MVHQSCFSESTPEKVSHAAEVARIREFAIMLTEIVTA